MLAMAKTGVWGKKKDFSTKRNPILEGKLMCMEGWRGTMGVHEAYRLGPNEYDTSARKGGGRPSSGKNEGPPFGEGGKRMKIAEYGADNSASILRMEKNKVDHREITK